MGVYVQVQKYYISSTATKYVNYDCHRYPIGFIGPKKFTLLDTLGSTHSHISLYIFHPDDTYIHIHIIIYFHQDNITSGRGICRYK